MKQNILSFLCTIKEDIFSLNKYLYDISENCFNEYKSCEYITNLLRKYNFKVESNFQNISTAFKAQIGTGHPEVCFICKYSTGDESGHVFGNNANAAMSIGAAIGLSHVIDKVGGSIIIIGCPGKYSNGAEIIMTREKVFEETDVIFAPHADNVTCLNNISLSSIPMELAYSNLWLENGKANLSSLDVCLQNIHFINQLIQDTCNHCFMDHLQLICDNALNEYPSSAKVRFEIKTKNYCIGEKIESNVRKYIKCIEEVMNIDCKLSLLELPCKELIDNHVINKLFESNLKECGLINITSGKMMLYPVGIGTVSHTTATIYPSINIVSNSSIKCPSLEFKEATISEFSKENIWKAIEALAITGLDLIERKDLICESTSELYKSIK